MRDHTNGTYGGTALLLDLIIRVSALAAVAGTKEALLFSVAAGALSRSVGPLLAVALPYAQAKPGAGEALNSFPSQPRAAAVVVIAGLITFFCVDDSAAYPLSLLATAVVIALVGWTAKQRLGGVTGDVMGAASELVELAVLTVLVATL
jgi:adenosylcobinamide-GDP ribazoletransferase